MGFNKWIPTIILITTSFSVKAQQIEKVFFNVYTDSLKIGVHNYINVDAKLTSGNYIPLTSKELFFTSNYGSWQGNCLLIDSAYKRDSVIIAIKLKSNPTITDSITLYIKKKEIAEKLKTINEFLRDIRERQN